MRGSRKTDDKACTHSPVVVEMAHLVGVHLQLVGGAAAVTQDVVVRRADRALVHRLRHQEEVEPETTAHITPH